MLSENRLNKVGSLCPALCVHSVQSEILRVILRVTGALVVAAIFLLGPTINSASAQKISEAQWKRGYQGFDVIVQGLRLKHFRSFREWQRAPAKETILIVLGSTSRPSSTNDRLRLLQGTQIDAYLENGGAVLVATDQNFAPGKSQYVRFRRLSANANHLEDAFQEYRDCPIVSNMKLPYLSGVKQIVTNRPGRITAESQTPWDIIGFLPPCNGSESQIPFAVGGEGSNGAKLMCFADQSIFSNQMLPHGDNALLAKSTLEYLKGRNRSSVLILNNGIVMKAVTPADLEVDLPQPTREEVIDAMKELPPSAVFEFANSVIGVVEDENLVNDFVRGTIDNIHPKKVNRFWIFCAFAIGCLIATWTYLFQKKLKRTTSSDIAFQKAEYNERNQKKIASSFAGKSKLCFERQMAVLAMLDAFCIERVDRRFNDLKRFPDELEVANDEFGTAIKNAMRQISNDFRFKPRDFWTTKRLLGVESAIEHWRRYFKMEMTPQPKSASRMNMNSKGNVEVVDAKIVK